MTTYNFWVQACQNSVRRRSLLYLNWVGSADCLHHIDNGYGSSDTARHTHEGNTQVFPANLFFHEFPTTTDLPPRCGQQTNTQQAVFHLPHAARSLAGFSRNKNGHSWMLRREPSESLSLSQSPTHSTKAYPGP
jgi:hypothetical protein